MFGPIAATALAIASGAHALRMHVAFPRASRPAHPVLLCNPRAGGGKVGRFHLREEARARGIEVIELTPGSDLEELAGNAVGRGADALAVAGGDGSQAIGIDGEAVLLTPPLRFRVRPAALRCRIARHHPGASPSAFAPASPWERVRALAGIAGGHDPVPTSFAGHLAATRAP